MLKIYLDRKRLETLIDINTLINSNYTDIKTLLTRIIESATRLSQGEASSLLLVHPENNKLYFEIALGKKGTEIKKFSLDMGEGIAGWVAEHNTSLIVNDVESDGRFNAEISRRLGFPTTSILAVPMCLKDRCVGVIEIINKKGEQEFTDDDLQWLEIFATQAAIAIQNARAYQKVQEEILLLQEEVKARRGFHAFIHESKEIENKLKIATKAAQTDSSVLLLGESGVGKELFAEQIHLNSVRGEKPFIRVNCAALPENLIESELFGHVKGAFTDATYDRRGRFELADGGTIFLDEIGDLPLSVQVKLLRVLQQKSFEKVGSSHTKKVDVRIIAATSKDIEQMVQSGAFRADLYYRLNVLPIYIPPLRDRKEDILILAQYFLNRYTQQTKKKIRGFTHEAQAQLLSYAWPGNVRELENIIERAAVITPENESISEDAVFSNSFSVSKKDQYHGKNLKEAINIFKKQFVAGVLNANGWNQTKTAEVLGIQRTYLSRLIKELGISKDNRS
jgi:transcriptional regulator with GAF, ATPase, and Fis domain